MSTKKKKEEFDAGWPGDADKLFVTGKELSFDVTFLRITGFDRHYITGFHKAADAVIDSITSQTRFDRCPQMFLAAAFLYRQSLELHLKYLIGASNSIGLTDFDTHGHHLEVLWNSSRGVLKKAWPNGDKTPVNTIARLVKEFSTVDKTGQEFRYSRRQDKKPSLEKLPKNPDAKNLKNTMTKVHKFLDGCCLALDAWFDSLNEHS